MRATIITIGDEILAGKVINWNAYWIAKRLTSMGIEVVRIFCVPDNIDAIGEALGSSISMEVDYIITTGGLGPTPGDITLEAISRALGIRLVLNEKALSFVKRRYSELKAAGLVDEDYIDDYRRKMALVPEGSDVLYNEVGVAPGVIIRYGKTTIFVLPGVPSEAMYLFEKIVPMLSRGALQISEEVIEVRDESMVAPILDKIRKMFPGVSIKTYPLGFGQKFMRVIAVGTDMESLHEALNTLRRELSKGSPPR